MKYLVACYEWYVGQSCRCRDPEIGVMVPVVERVPCSPALPTKRCPFVSQVNVGRHNRSLSYSLLHLLDAVLLPASSESAVSELCHRLKRDEKTSSGEVRRIGLDETVMVVAEHGSEDVCVDNDGWFAHSLRARQKSCTSVSVKSSIVRLEISLIGSTADSAAVRSNAKKSPPWSS